MEERTTTIRLPEMLHRRVKAKAALQATTITAVVREYLERWVEEELPKEPEKED
jgi:predicted DNA-binding protein